MSPGDDRIRILYIAGVGHSGSTLLGHMLGQLPEIVCLGELQRLWLRGPIQNQPCACRDSFDACPFWRQVFDLAFNGPKTMDARILQGVMDREIRTRSIPAFLLNRKRPDSSEELTVLGEALTALYRAGLEATDSSWIVDTSKSPIYGRFLMQLPGFQVHVLHLVRDPRGVAHSYRRMKAHPLTGESRLRMGVYKSSALWTIWNLATIAFAKSGRVGRRYLRVRYEDFVQNPEQVFSMVAAVTGEKFDGELFVGPNQVELQENHMLSGNVVRYKLGRVRIVPDMEWKSAMPSSHKALVSALTLPLLPLFGYPIHA